MMPKQRSGITTIMLVISLLIVAVTTVIVISYLIGQHLGGSGNMVTSVQRAKSVECLAQIRKIEMQVQLYSVQHGRYPESLEILDVFTDSDLHCPVTQNRYIYDPQSGRIYCPDHTR
jgi:competence protein ComGC